MLGSRGEMKDKHHSDRQSPGRGVWSVQLNSCRLFIPVGGEQRDPDAGLRERCLERGSSAWGLVERKEMPHLWAVFVRLTNAASLPPLTAAAGCSGQS